MRLTDLTKGLEYRLLQGTEDKDVNALIYFSEEAVPGCMFFAVPGTERNGLDFAAEAVKRGTSAVVTEEFWTPPQNLCTGEFCRMPGVQDVTVLLVKNVRKAMAEISCRFYGYPCRKLLTIGITGTKGKTSTAFMVRQILEKAGISTGLVGTVKSGWEGNFQEAERTTPQSVEIQRWFRNMADHGCRALVMEVSSQGIKQNRVDGIHFDIGIFTNLSPDHIGPGEHESFEEYAAYKAGWIRQCRTAVINRDEDVWNTFFPDGCAAKKITFGTCSEADFCCDDIRRTDEGERIGTAFRLDGEALYIPLPGIFNAINAAGAAAAARQLGIGWNTIREALKGIKIPGRLEPVDTGGKTRVMVDYAHNGISLRHVLQTLRQYEPERLIVVFGCGGNRDRSRRREMGRAAAELADLAIVTSDNPRFEEPEQIIKDITGAMDEAIAEGAHGRYRVIPDRKMAIFTAVTEGRKHDMILIAGKGHETYQLVKGEKIYFNDRETAEEAARESGQNTINKVMGEKET